MLLRAAWNFIIPLSGSTRNSENAFNGPVTMKEACLLMTTVLPWGKLFSSHTANGKKAQDKKASLSGQNKYSYWCAVGGGWLVNSILSFSLITYTLYKLGGPIRATSWLSSIQISRFARASSERPLPSHLLDSHEVARESITKQPLIGPPQGGTEGGMRSNNGDRVLKCNVLQVSQGLLS